ncbi:MULTISPECIES: hypothetical protein [Caulobacter]|jgi:hypothetical protein|uniref:Uncharacterized protein n=1 Tax=Caulobacter vibrioides OR37 TaxID=1292034 RepID=R0EJB9_CAUVI|nr:MULTISPECIES: hypothetical protein [Caulobacter]ENZ81212.1 hypothetical protein OR37_02921 [Caulobacter vibrioides OR37]MBQ1562530.1 hypothetical protein [Caulobacter sp.]
MLRPILLAALTVAALAACAPYRYGPPGPAAPSPSRVTPPPPPIDVIRPKVP